MHRNFTKNKKETKKLSWLRGAMSMVASKSHAQIWSSRKSLLLERNVYYYIITFTYHQKRLSGAHIHTCRPLSSFGKSAIAFDVNKKKTHTTTRRCRKMRQKVINNKFANTNDHLMLILSLRSVRRTVGRSGVTLIFTDDHVRCFFFYFIFLSCTFATNLDAVIWLMIWPSKNNAFVN